MISSDSGHPEEFGQSGAEGAGLVVYEAREDKGRGTALTEMAL